MSILHTAQTDGDGSSLVNASRDASDSILVCATPSQSKPSDESGLDSRARFYRPELDGLRFYAFLGVFLFHSLPLEDSFYAKQHFPLPSLWATAARAGSCGVDLFFVLSAYLITSLLVRERQAKGSISISHFYLRRVLRIWPLYFFLVALGAVFAFLPGIGKYWYYNQHLSWQYILGYLFFAANWVYAAMGNTHSICAPLWTISIEEQFYIVWPVMMKVLRPHTLWIAAVVTFSLSILVSLIMVLMGADAGYIYFGSAPRCGSLALGILLAVFADRLPSPGRTARLVVIGLGVGICLVASARLSDFSGPASGPASLRTVLDRTLPGIACAAILYAVLHTRSRIVTGSWPVRLGKISYGLYALHSLGILLVLSFFRPEPGRELLAAKGAGLILTVALAFVSYRWLESPFLRLKDRFAPIPSRPT